MDVKKMTAMKRESGGAVSYPAESSQEILYKIFENAPDAILLVDMEGRITMANAQAENMFGYRREELLGQPVEILIPPRLAARHVKYRAEYGAAPRIRPMGAGLELFGHRKDGSEFPVDIMLSPLEVEGSSLFLGVVRDTTERKRIETQAARVREMYLKEVHHRVKNNLQVISSLFYLQSTYTSDPRILEILLESQSRVRSISLIHEKLYRSPRLGKLDFGEYVQDLVADLLRTYDIQRESLAVHTSVDDIHLGVDTAVPCGLIINELITNVFKHAFPAGRVGAAGVELFPLGLTDFRLVVWDNGVGLPPDFDWRTTNSLGLKLVHDLTRQLEGTMEVRSNHGAMFLIRFKELQYKDRS
ncbi:MAG: PAS domain S-box protein [Candidatus Hydrogenedentes bacterium]|nr:PAS domain S-box protein [Candidatus Hydrogenedentota bacterium]